MIIVNSLQNKEQTSKEMLDLVNRFSNDIQFFAVEGISLKDLTLDSYYNLISQIPFQKDIEGVEMVSRPFLLLDAPWSGWDCKKKSILMAAYLKENGIPFRFMSSSSKPNGRIHHVYPEAYIDNKWLPVDATYPHNQLFQQKEWTAKELLTGEENGYKKNPILVSMYGDGEPTREMTINFINKRKLIAPWEPETIGQVGTIIGAIIGVVGLITTGIIGAVSSKRQQERAAAAQLKAIAYQKTVIKEEQEEIEKEIAEKKAAAAEKTASKTKNLVENVGVPVGVGAGIFALIKTVF